MRTDTSTPRFTRTPHLVGLVGEAERLAALIAGASEEARAGASEELRARAAVASLRLDGSPIEVPPDPEALAAGRDADAGTTAAGDGRRGDWFRTMRVDEDIDEHVQALEYLGVIAALASDDLADRVLTAPGATLAELHRRLTRGLLAEDRAGTPRRTEQAVHDASVGRIIYFTVEPADVPTRLALLGGWLQSTAAREHALIVSGVLHLDLLHIHPFEAANGRLARAAARLVLRARGLDPDGLAVPEATLARDPLGYHEDVAATLRRRDHTVWLERWGEAVSAGLREAARHLGLLDPQVAARASTFVEQHPSEVFTIADYRAGARTTPEEARADLECLLDAGRVLRVPGSRGLRYERTPA